MVILLAVGRLGVARGLGRGRTTAIVEWPSIVSWPTTDPVAQGALGPLSALSKPHFARSKHVCPHNR